MEKGFSWDFIIIEQITLNASIWILSGLFLVRYSVGTSIIHNWLWCWFDDGNYLKRTGPWFNINMSSYQYRKSHCGYKTVVRSSYLHNGISYTGKMSSLYWIGPQVLILTVLHSMAILNTAKSQKWKGHQGDSLGVCWKHWSLPSMSTVNIRVVSFNDLSFSVIDCLLAGTIRPSFLTQLFLLQYDYSGLPSVLII